MGERRLDVVVVPRSGPSVTSMDRVAAALLTMDSDTVRTRRPSYAAQGTSPSANPWAGRWRRWVQDPLVLRRSAGDIFHLVDHSDAHLIRALPAERTIVTCHDLVLLQALAREVPYRGRRWWGARFRWTVGHLRQAAAVACDSEATCHDVSRFLGVSTERLHVIPLAAGSHFRPLAPGERADVRSRRGFDGRRVLLHVGSGGFYKNTATVFEVVARLRKEGDDVVVARAGVGLSDDERSVIARLELDDVVLDAGRVNEQELVELYGAADALLFPSTGEGFGLPVLEAMSCGLPVIASAIPPLMELTGPAARLAPPQDVAALTALVHNVLHSPGETERMRQQGLERAGSYSWDRTLAAYGRLYEAVFAGSMARR